MTVYEVGTIASIIVLAVGCDGGDLPRAAQLDGQRSTWCGVRHVTT